MARVFVDTNVLFPFSVMDLMLALSEDAIHEVLWTETLLAEWERVIVRERHRSAESAASITAAIREFFPESRIAEDEYVQLIPEMPGQDPDDRHHMAAAVMGDASTIVTWNRADFPADGLARHGIRVMDPDDYLCELIVELPHEVVDTVVRMSGQKKRPPLTPYAMVQSLAAAGVPNFAVRLKDHLDSMQAGAAGRSARSGVARTGNVIPSIGASDIGAYLATRRPPDYHDVKLIVPPHEPVGTASHLFVLNTVFLEMLKVWPAGTTLVVEYDDDAYAQALAYPPDILTEIGRLDSSQMTKAVQFGWIDPTGFSTPHGDFKSQPVWIDNPVREWTHPSDGPREIAAFLAASVRAILDRDPGDGYIVHIFNDLLDQPHES